MSSSQFISVRETAQMLAITEKKVMDLIEERKLQAYKIADRFLRLKKAEVLSLRNTGSVEQEHIQIGYSALDRIRDFFYFNDFYIFSIFVIFALLYIVFLA